MQIPNRFLVPNATILHSGSYNVIVKNAFNCKDTATTIVKINAQPTISFISNSPVCYNTDLDVSAFGGISYNWSGPNNFMGIGNNIVVPKAKAINAGIYQVIVTDQNNCSATASTSVEVRNDLKVTCTSNSPICTGNSLVLDAAGGKKIFMDGAIQFYVHP